MATLQRGPDPEALASESTSDDSARQTPTRQQVEVDVSAALAGYANFCRVTGTPEEIIVEFGLTGQHQDDPARAILITQRVITNPYTAKRLVQVLEMVVQRHEAMFGVLETDVQRRVRRT